MAYQKTTWVDEVIQDGIPLYEIKDSDGDVIAEDATIEMTTPVVTQGTEFTAQRMNNIEDAIEIHDIVVNNVLQKTNMIPFTPTDDYHPATKKYVDDLSGLSSGTWTPTPSPITGTYEQRQGYWTKIGKMVYLCGYIEFKSVTSNTTGTNLTITGAPFAPNISLTNGVGSVNNASAGLFSEVPCITISLDKSINFTRSQKGGAVTYTFTSTGQLRFSLIYTTDE